MTLLRNSSFKIKCGTVPQIQRVEPEAGAFLLNEHDGLFYWADRYGWSRPGELAPMRFFVEFDGTNQFALTWKAPSTGSLTFKWGDGTESVIAGADAGIINTSSAYTTPGIYYLTISGAVNTMTWFRMLNQPHVFGDVTYIGEMTALEVLALVDMNITGDVGRFNQFTSLSSFSIQNAPNLSGDVSQVATVNGGWTLRDCRNLSFDNEADLSGVIGGTFARNGFSTDEIDRILASLVGASNFEMAFTDNDPPSIYSRSNIDTLIAADNILTFGAPLPWFNLGPEQYVTPNAIAILNEADAVTGWIATGLGSPNEFESQKGNKINGRFAFFVNGNPAPTSAWNIEQTLTVVDTEVTQVAFKIKHSGIGEWLAYRLFGYNTIGYILYNDMVEWRDVVTYMKNQGTSMAVRFGEVNSDNNGSFFLDKFSVRKATS